MGFEVTGSVTMLYQFSPKFLSVKIEIINIANFELHDVIITYFPILESKASYGQVQSMRS